MPLRRSILRGRGIFFQVLSSPAGHPGATDPATISETWRGRCARRSPGRCPSASPVAGGRRLDVRASVRVALGRDAHTGHHRRGAACPARRLWYPRPDSNRRSRLARVTRRGVPGTPPVVPPTGFEPALPPCQGDAARRARHAACGTPDRIRTGATALRGRRARPLHNGGKHVKHEQGETLANGLRRTKSRPGAPGRGGLDFARPPNAVRSTTEDRSLDHRMPFVRRPNAVRPTADDGSPDHRRSFVRTAKRVRLNAGEGRLERRPRCAGSAEFGWDTRTRT